jgi:hypothetical protein
MNTQAINRIIANIDNGRKTCKTGKKVQPKAGRADRLRRTNEYTLKKHNQERRKQTKVRYDTHRRYEEPSTEDSVMEEIHLANFLGNSSKAVCDNEYITSVVCDLSNNQYTTNINMCDMFTPETQALAEAKYIAEAEAEIEKDRAFAEQQDKWGWMVSEEELYYDYNSDAQSTYECDEEEDRRDNYTEWCYDDKLRTYRIWQPIAGHSEGGRFVGESDDESVGDDHSCY